MSVCMCEYIIILTYRVPKGVHYTSISPKKSISDDGSSGQQEPKDSIYSSRLEDKMTVRRNNKRCVLINIGLALCHMGNRIYGEISISVIALWYHNSVIMAV